jgi:hypothetical protein
LLLQTGTNMLGEQLRGKLEIAPRHCLKNRVVLVMDSLQRGRILARPLDGEETNEKTHVIDHLLQLLIHGHMHQHVVKVKFRNHKPMHLLSILRFVFEVCDFIGKISS